MQTKYMRKHVLSTEQEIRAHNNLICVDMLYLWVAVVFKKAGHHMWNIKNTA